MSDGGERRLAERASLAPLAGRAGAVGPRTAAGSPPTLAEYGDFPTPIELAREILTTLGPIGEKWSRVLEPTCGDGAFIHALVEHAQPPKEIFGVEVQGDRFVGGPPKLSTPQTLVTVANADILRTDLRRLTKWTTKGPLLVVGNPPWVTTAELARLGRGNLPPKSNDRNLKGIEAITGASNFDLSEFIWLKLLRDLAPLNPSIALLCKTTVARNVIRYAQEQHLNVYDGSMRMIDAHMWFGVSAPACLFTLHMGHGAPDYTIRVYDSLDAPLPSALIGIVNGHLVPDVAAYQKVSESEGTFPFEWRQGIKHDAAAVMELVLDDDGKLYNRLGEEVDVEREFVYPLLKSSDLGSERPKDIQRRVIVTQRKSGEDTTVLRQEAPKLWAYLSSHSDVFDARRSRIYLGGPPFAMFGVGPYSFSPCKVAISGMYKRAVFRAIGQIDGRPVMLDDTCYFVPTEDPMSGAVLAALLNSDPALDFFEAVTFYDAKRPMTKGLLQRVNLESVWDQVDPRSLARRAEVLIPGLRGASPSPTPRPPANYTEFVRRLLR
ncbi:MAG: SAM-dependent methyltransferase [Thermoplasmata archaeon]|nr:SAM-dependent methyltransferase [Thermoplasmata archaeon]MCI4355765.1 SAM-dependent methyltransferase [Thermoplasmata archaeon]